VVFVICIMTIMRACEKVVGTKKNVRGGILMEDYTVPLLFKYLS